jgi:L-lactate utilization protein LutC
MSNAREQILQNLRKGAAPASSQESQLLPAFNDAIIFRNYEPARQQPLQWFTEKIAALKGEFYLSQNETAAAKTLRELLVSSVSLQDENSSPKQSAARHRHPLLDRICAADEWLASNVQIIDGRPIASPDFAQFAVGITAVDFLVARTGSIILSAATAGGRRLSVLPPFHVAIATTDQLVISLDEAMATYQQRKEFNRSSYATIITGPSRTSDIEKILVLGAHGPKRLAVILVEESV